MDAREIIYNKLRFVWVNSKFVCISDLDRMANAAVEEIREEFKKAGVDVWKGGEE